MATIEMTRPIELIPRAAAEPSGAGRPCSISRWEDSGWPLRGDGGRAGFGRSPAVTAASWLGPLLCPCGLRCRRDGGGPTLRGPRVLDAPAHLVDVARVVDRRRFRPVRRDRSGVSGSVCIAVWPRWLRWRSARAGFHHAPGQGRHRLGCAAHAGPVPALGPDLGDRALPRDRGHQRPPPRRSGTGRRAGPAGRRAGCVDAISPLVWRGRVRRWRWRRWRKDAEAASSLVAAIPRRWR